jgi:transposase
MLLIIIGMEAIMTPQKREQTKPMFHYFQMEDLVPEDHILRQIDKLVDFSFVHDTVKDSYCPDNGRPGVDPELVVRMILLGYLYNLSENRLCQEVKMHAEKRLFCHMTSFEDTVPDRSTINKLRNHRWATSGLFQTIMRRIVQYCIDAGLVSGRHLSVDGTQIRANASVKSIEPIEPPVSLDDYLTGIGLAGDGSTPRDTSRDSCHPQDKDFHGERFTNETHRSTTDPTARLYKKSKGKEASLSYIGNDLIDTKSRVILATKASIATGTAEREAALEMIDPLETYMLPCEAPILAGDTGYGSGDFIVDLIDRGIIPHIPLRAGAQPEAIPTWKNRTKHAHIQVNRDNKVREAQARNYIRRISSTALFKLSQKLRKRNEHLFAEAKQNHGMDRARYRGLNPLQEQLYLTASVQNLKRLASFTRRKKAAAQVQISLMASSNSPLSPCISWITHYIKTLPFCICKKVADLMIGKKNLLFSGALSS